jgi:hypothetical protein
LVLSLLERKDWSQADSQGFQAIEAELKLSGWSRKRRVVIVRRRIKESEAKPAKVENGQLRLALGDEQQLLDAAKMWEHTVLVSNASYPLESIAQLYRDRCDCENGFDELKNQWGLSGFTTQDIKRCQTTARAAALIYNWWSWYCRAGHPGARLEAVTSRPLLLAAVGKATSHAGQTQLYLTPMHAKTETIKTLVSNIRKALGHIKACAEQLARIDRWATFYVCQLIVPTPLLQPAPQALGGYG